MSTVLVIGDTHCPGMRRGYVSFLKSVADEYQPDRVVHIGDLVDWGTISYHEKLPNLHGSIGEFKKAKRQVQSLYEAFPEADWLLGNHDALAIRQAASAGMPEDVLREPTDLWEIPGWKCHPRFTHLEIDGVLYAHGDGGVGGMYAHANQAKQNFQSTVIGHFHGNAGIYWHANPANRIFGMAVGCGIDVSNPAFRYAANIRRKPILGCGVVINGKRPFFEPWLLKSRA